MGDAPVEGGHGRLVQPPSQRRLTEDPHLQSGLPPHNRGGSGGQTHDPRSNYDDINPLHVEIVGFGVGFTGRHWLPYGSFRQRKWTGSMREGGSVHKPTVEGFGYEWTKFDQSEADPDELEGIFRQYFAIFPWNSLPPGARGFDLGCGSGRWAPFVASRTGTLVGLDASIDALRVARRNAPKFPLVLGVAGALPLRPSCMDFGYSLGVLHHIPEPLRGLSDAVGALKPGAPFLVYLYYAFDNRPRWFRAVWQASDGIRRVVSRCPAPVRYGISQTLALAVYLPLARVAAWLERRGRTVSSMPLSSYRHRSLYVMRTDALDRFGTRLERRFTRPEVAALLERAGLERVTVSDESPYWCAVGYKPPG